MSVHCEIGDKIQPKWLIYKNFKISNTEKAEGTTIIYQKHLKIFSFAICTWLNKKYLKSCVSKKIEKFNLIENFLTYDRKLKDFLRYTYDEYELIYAL